MLSEDGSFYYDDKRLAEEVGMDTKTIMRAKRFLRENGYINYKLGFSKGNATKYWILRKPDKKSPFVDISKPDNLSAKPDNLSLKAPQKVTPNNVYNNDINKEVISSLTEKDIEGIKSLGKLRGIPYATTFFINRGFSEVEVKKALEGGDEDVKKEIDV